MGPEEMARLWDEHTAGEFALRDVDATMATMVPEPHVVHLPTLIGLPPTAGLPVHGVEIAQRLRSSVSAGPAPVSRSGRADAGDDPEDVVVQLGDRSAAVEPAGRPVRSVGADGPRGEERRRLVRGSRSRRACPHGRWGPPWGHV
jgi:hypothetical protein